MISTTREKTTFGQYGTDELAQMTDLYVQQEQALMPTQLLIPTMMSLPVLSHHNTVFFFPSHCYHAALPVTNTVDDDFLSARLSINGHIQA